ncbi:uncharacterized protein LOC100905899 [Galendromus occidentalis]|uniref:Uncharacterized protein LOC100905899 n=1 Tax=Galendromus occidentalis TaxID=34638 RepID=A0AAJ6QNP1_9ACAR|nr:uncharacterized protein LOC100905899 [Galendromus occidentalis]
MRSLENVTLKICFTEVFPYVVSVGDGITPKGMQGSIFTNITESMGLKWIRVPAPNNKWGECDINGTCHGQLEPLKQGTADIALGPIVLSNEVFTTLRSGWPTYFSTLDLLAGFKSPFKSRGHLGLFNLYPIPIWASILLCLFILPVLAKLLSRFGTIADRATLAEHWSSFMEIFLLECPSFQYSTNPMRVLFASWMLAAFVLSSLGSATLKSVMTVISPASKLETLQDILRVDISKTTIRTTAGTGLMDMLETSALEPIRSLAKKIIDSEGLTHPLDIGTTWMLRELETEKSVFILGCEVVFPFLYSPPSLKLQGTQGYTYCSKDVMGFYLSGWVASRRKDPIFQFILDEFDKR